MLPPVSSRDCRRHSGSLEENNEPIVHTNWMSVQSHYAALEGKRLGKVMMCRRENRLSLDDGSHSVALRARMRQRRVKQYIYLNKCSL